MDRQWARIRHGGRPNHGGALLQPTLHIHTDVIDHAAAEIRDNPHIEVGGKFVGYVQGGFLPSDNHWRAGFNNLQITVLGHLDAGPGRDRSAVHHYSDTDYQFRLFQRVTAEIPALCFLGIWHSHHPNGLRELSNGDAETGLRTVNSDGHELDLLLSSLAFDEDGLLGGRHYVFLRGHRTYYEIDSSRIVVVNGENPISAAIARNARWLRSGIEGQRTPAGMDEPAPDQPSPDDSLPDAQHSQRTAPYRVEVHQERRVRRASWLDSPDGKAALVFDQKWLRSYPSMHPSLRQDAVVWLGPVDVGVAEFSCAYYLSGKADEPAIAEISAVDGTMTLRLVLDDPQSRASRFAAALTAFSTMTMAMAMEVDNRAETTLAAGS